MNKKAWIKQNTDTIEARMRPLVDAGEGLINVERAGELDVVVCKMNSFIHLMWVDPKNPNLKQTESRMDPKQPLHLLTPYNQLSMLGLVWKPEPANIYVLGFGGGRIPMVLHHHLPDTNIECAEIDPVMVDMATRFFGVGLDERLSVAVQDGREYLDDVADEHTYDIIHVDGFLANGFSSYPLVTKEFFELCARRLSDDGVVVVNVLSYDNYHLDKIKTIASVFKNIYLVFTVKGNTVVFATNADVLTLEQIVQRAEALQAEHNFTFPIVEYASKFHFADEFDTLFKDYDKAVVLSDATPPERYFTDVPAANLQDEVTEEPNPS